MGIGGLGMRRGSRGGRLGRDFVARVGSGERGRGRL